MMRGGHGRAAELHRVADAARPRQVRRQGQGLRAGHARDRTTHKPALAGALPPRPPLHPTRGPPRQPSRPQHPPSPAPAPRPPWSPPQSSCPCPPAAPGTWGRAGAAVEGGRAVAGATRRAADQRRPPRCPAWAAGAPLSWAPPYRLGPPPSPAEHPVHQLLGAPAGQQRLPRGAGGTCRTATSAGRWGRARQGGGGSAAQPAAGRPGGHTCSSSLHSLLHRAPRIQPASHPPTPTHPPAAHLRLLLRHAVHAGRVVGQPVLRLEPGSRGGVGRRRGVVRVAARRWARRGVLASACRRTRGGWAGRPPARPSARPAGSQRDVLGQAGAGQRVGADGLEEADVGHVALAAAGVGW